jgi:hypothetical protein
MVFTRMESPRSTIGHTISPRYMRLLGGEGCYASLPVKVVRWQLDEESVRGVNYHDCQVAFLKAKVVGTGGRRDGCRVAFGKGVVGD